MGGGGGVWLVRSRAIVVGRVEELEIGQAPLYRNVLHYIIYTVISSSFSPIAVISFVPDSITVLEESGFVEVCVSGIAGTSFILQTQSGSAQGNTSLYIIMGLLYGSINKLTMCLTCTYVCL